jgi:hypothetical protein
VALHQGNFLGSSVKGPKNSHVFEKISSGNQLSVERMKSPEKIKLEKYGMLERWSHLKSHIQAQNHLGVMKKPNCAIRSSSK